MTDRARRVAEIRAVEPDLRRMLGASWSGMAARWDAVLHRYSDPSEDHEFLEARLLALFLDEPAARERLVRQLDGVRSVPVVLVHRAERAAEAQALRMLLLERLRDLDVRTLEERADAMDLRPADLPSASYVVALTSVPPSGDWLERARRAGVVIVALDDARAWADVVLTGSEDLVSFLLAELHAPDIRERGAPSALLDGASRREIRLVSRHCMGDDELRAFLWDQALPQTRFPSATLHGRVLDLLHLVEGRGFAAFVRWLEKEKPECVRRCIDELRSAIVYDPAERAGCVPAVPDPPFPSDSPVTPHVRLRELLVALFTSAEMWELLAAWPEVRTAIQGPEHAKAALYAGDIVEALHRRGVLDAPFLGALLAARPLEKAVVLDVAEALAQAEADAGRRARLSAWVEQEREKVPPPSRKSPEVVIDVHHVTDAGGLTRGRPNAKSQMAAVDVLIITALKMELDAAHAALVAAGARMTPCDEATSSPYLRGSLPTQTQPLVVALARPTRMGATATGPLAGALAERLRPRCLAMSGVCAGNPADVTLGDVVVAECAYAYDEGKRTTGGFEPDHRQIQLGDRWLRAAQEAVTDGLPSYGAPTLDDRRRWLLSQLDAGGEPRKHPARDRYLGGKRWTSVVRDLERKGLIHRDGRTFAMTDAGREELARDLAYTIESPTRLPFAIRVGPMASGNVVVKDGVTWGSLKAWGVRDVLGLEMEAATIAQTAQRLEIPHWLVAKGVMDHADPNKEDRIKPFAARASAEVLIRLLQTVPFEAAPTGRATLT